MCQKSLEYFRRRVIIIFLQISKKIMTHNPGRISPFSGVCSLLLTMKLYDWKQPIETANEPDEPPRIHEM
jgi:hypothetical protein